MSFKKLMKNLELDFLEGIYLFIKYKFCYIVMRILAIPTICHEGHEVFWKSIDADVERLLCRKSIWLRFLNSLRIPKNYDIYLTENISSMSFLKNNKLFLRKILLVIVADSLAYVYMENPEWYFKDKGFPLQALKGIHLKSCIEGLKLVDGFICVSNLISQYVKKISNSMCYVVRPSINPSKLKYLTKMKPHLDSHTIVFVGSGIWKNFPLLLETFQKVRKEFPDSRLIVKTDVKTKNKYFSKVSEKEGITVVTKRLSNYEYSKLLSSGAVYLQTSYIDPHPVAVAESMVVGVIPVVTELVGTKELFEKRYPYLISPPDAEELSNRICKIFELNDRKRREISLTLKKLSKSVYPSLIEKEFKLVFERMIEEIL